MTAEIAVLNNAAVVLAADSAVSIGQGPDVKIFNSANKIFEIGTQDPVALMVFNRLDFMGLPIEVLAKEFRSKRCDTTFERLSDWVEDFLSFLKNEVPIHEADLDDQFTNLAYQTVSDLERRLRGAVSDQLARAGRVLKSKLNQMLEGLLTPMVAAVERQDDAKGLAGLKLSAAQKELVNKLSAECFAGMALTQANLRLIQKLVTLRLKKETMSPMHTGLVFAGYGRDELCPTLIHVDIDGLIGTELKRRASAEVDIDRNGPHAEVLGFAQDDMVKSFVDGADPYFSHYASQVLSDATYQSADLVVSALGLPEDQTRQALANLGPSLQELDESLQRALWQFAQRNFTQQVKQMVRLMPKDEMARLAESLIEITSLKRRVTRDRETVGGQVDVAVITKSEGLVWVKRKHYFPAEINSRYFARQKGEPL